MSVKTEVLFRLLLDDIESQTYPGFPKDCQGPMWPDMTKREAACYSIVNSLLKKESKRRTRATDDLARKKFLAVNERCRAWRLEVNDYRSEVLLNGFKQAIDDFWFKDGHSLVFHEFELLDYGGVGPGVSLGCRGNSFFAKLFSSPLTCSSSSERTLYERYMCRFPRWLAAEKARESSWGAPSVTCNNKLSFVPKNDKISRTICIETTLGSFFQAGLGRIIERRLDERFGISLSRQPDRNRYLAYLGSVTNALSTIDLASASDSMSLSMLKWALPEGFYNLLCKHRSTHTIDGDKTHELHMVSTMGNGYTFPLQTMLFSCVVASCLSYRDLTPRRNARFPSLWGVFGDDIICPSTIYSDVTHLLGLLGFEINSDKSFAEGPFRESCGVDFFLGENVRGVYIKTVDTPESRYSAINQLIQFSARTGVYLHRIVGYLRESVDFLPIPRGENADGGIWCPLSVAYPYTRPSRDKWMGREYRVRVPRNRKYRIGYDGVISVPSGSKSLGFNPDGLVLSFLQGGIYHMQFGVREDTVRYVTKRRASSMWDSSIGVEKHLARRWKSVATYYLERA